MSERLARYLTVLIAVDYDKKVKGCISSYECELIEKELIKGNFEEVEKYLTNKLWRD